MTPRLFLFPALSLCACSAAAAAPSASGDSSPMNDAPALDADPDAAPAPCVPSADNDCIALGLDTPPANEQAVLTEIGHGVAILDGFFGWQGLDGSFIPFPSDFVTAVKAAGATPMITWQPAKAGPTGGPPPPDQPDFTDAVLATSRYDDFLRAWADGAKAFGGPLYLRLMHEPNDNQYPWAYGVNGNTAEQYVSAFRHVVSVFRAEHADNVSFVWCVGAVSYGKAPAPIAALYPGDDFVDWASMDGYNRNNTSLGFEPFEQIFKPFYDEIVGFSRRPILIAETASVEDTSATGAGAKADWIRHAFLDAVPNTFPRIRAIAYFDARGAAGKDYTYALDSSPEALAAFRDVAAAPVYQAVAPPTSWLYP